ncbi:MAG TPA: GNAT family N-acetyltransferase [Solirubrobacterales bacterium]|nr:GNAT family N-acetyltransferase [Solirubrobacterales bacterium]
MTARVLQSLDELAPIRARWDQLAVESQRPFAAPAWALAWWKRLRPDNAQLRVLVFEDGDRLAGVIPLFAAGRSYRPIGGGLAPVDPLSRAGFEERVAGEAARLLAELELRPRTLELELHGSGPDWAGMLSGAWGGGRGAWRWVESEVPIPCVDLGDGFEEWMGGKSSSFRRDLRRNRRKLDDAGAEFRFATAETVERDVGEFLRLHRMRLAGQGGTSLPSEGIEPMLLDVAADLLPSERFRLLSLELGGQTIASQLLLAAGREVSAWNSGFDEAHRAHSPSMQCIVHALTDASERGERTMSLGPGGQDYKYRLSNSEDCVRSSVIVPRGASYPLARLRLAPRQGRRALAGRLSADAKRRLRRFGRA